MEKYYLVPKHLMEMLMSDLGSFAYLTNSYEELHPISITLTNCPIIDLSDKAIKDKVEIYLDMIHSNDYEEDNPIFKDVAKIITKVLKDLK